MTKMRHENVMSIVMALVHPPVPLMYKQDLYILAYKRIKSKAGNMAVEQTRKYQDEVLLLLCKEMIGIRAIDVISLSQ